MQTFMPTRGYYTSMAMLDTVRLGNQRNEAMVLLTSLLALQENSTSEVPWSSHPALKMWSGYEYSLAQYGAAAAWTFRKRGHADSLHVKFLHTLPHHPARWSSPPWWTDTMLHTSHRSNLMRKNPEWYSRFFSTKPDLPYLWPVFDPNGELGAPNRGYYLRITKSDEEKIESGELRLPDKWLDSGRVFFSP